MKPKTLILLATAAAVAGLLALFFSRSGATASKAPAGVGERVLRDFPLNDVTRIRIASAEGEAVVERGESGWVVPAREGYPASFDQVSRLLRKVWETKVVQTVAAGPSALGRLQLLAPGQGENAPAPGQTGTLLEFFDAGGKLLGSLIIGKESVSGDADSPWTLGGSGRFVLNPARPDRVVVVAESFSDAQPRVRDWLDRDFFAIQKARSITVTNAEGATAWKASRASEADQFALEDAPKDREADPNKLSPLSTLLAYPRIEDVAGKNPAAEGAGLDKPVKAVIETFDGFTYNLSVGAPGPDSTRHLTLAVSASLPEKRNAPEGESEEDKKRLDEEFEARVKTLREKLDKEKKFEGWVFLVPETQVADLLKSSADFLKPKEEKAQEPVSAATPPVSAPAPEPKKTPAKKK